MGAPFLNLARPRVAILREQGVNSHVEMEPAIDAFLTLYEAIHREKPIKGLRWAFSHIDQITPAQIERIFEHVPVATHNQRGLGTLHIGVCQTYLSAAWPIVRSRPSVRNLRRSSSDSWTGLRSSGGGCAPTCSWRARHAWRRSGPWRSCC